MYDNCKIFLCYRDCGAYLAKNFSIYVNAKVNGNKFDSRNYGKCWYSDLEVGSDYKYDVFKEIFPLIKYFIIFIHENFTDGFLLEDGITPNENCITAKEIVEAVRKNQNGELKIIIVYINRNKKDGFSEKERHALTSLFNANFPNENINEFKFWFINAVEFKERITIEEDFFETILEGIVDLNKDENLRIYFGNYPQEVVKDRGILENLNELYPFNNLWKSYGYFFNGQQESYMYYLDVNYNNCRYRGVYFDKCRPYFINGQDSYQERINEYKPKNRYWFKFSKITWRIVHKMDESYILVTEKALDSQPFNTNKENNYENSSLRKWLNKDFYEIAFNESEKKKILECCDNSSDRISILSRSEYKMYLFDPSQRRILPTDYALCQGVYKIHYTIDQVDWWLRDNDDFDSEDAYYINWLGDCQMDNVTYTNGGIVPMIYIRKQNEK